MLINNSNNVLSLSLIVNKGQIKESSKRGADVLVTSIHNGSITSALDTGKYFAQFRLYSEKQGEIPMFVKTGTKVKEIEQQISSKKFMELFYGGNYIDTKFYVNLNEDICEAINDSTCKSIKFTFSSSSITERKDEEYQGNTIACYSIDSVEIETLDTYYGIGRKVENNHVVNCIETSLEEAVTKKINTVTADELKEKAENLSKNGKKKLIKEVESLIKDSSILDEFNKFKFSSDVEEFQSQLASFKRRASSSQVNALENSLKEEESVISESTPLSQEEMNNFLLDMTS